LCMRMRAGINHVLIVNYSFAFQQRLFGFEQRVFENT
jgi:hypothetical protein